MLLFELLIFALEGYFSKNRPLELHGEQNCFEQQNNFLQDITDSHKGLHMDRQTLLLIVLVSYITKLTGLHR